MGQKINPVSLRLQSSNRHFDNCWYSKYFYTNLLTQDLFLQNYFNNFLKGVKLPTGRYSIQHLPKKTQVYNFFCMNKQTREWRSKVFGLLKRKNSLKKTRYFFKTKRQGKRKVYSSTKLISFYKTVNPITVYKIQKKFTSFQNFQLWSRLLKTSKNGPRFLNWKDETISRQIGIPNLSTKLKPYQSREIGQVMPKFFLIPSKNLMRTTLKTTTFFPQSGLIEKIKTPSLISKNWNTVHKAGIVSPKNDDWSCSSLYKEETKFKNLEMKVENNSCLFFLHNLFIYKTLKIIPLKTKELVYKKNTMERNNKKIREFNISQFHVLNSKYKNYLETSLSSFFNKQIELIPFKVKSEWQNASTLADEIVYFLEKRVPFRRLKSNLLKQLSKNPQIRGVRITCSGRGGGKSKKAQRAKTECIKYGQTSLHVLSSPIDFAVKTAFTSFGSVGVKVWISFN